MNKKIFIILVIVIIVVIFLTMFLLKKRKEKNAVTNEIQPEEEISMEEERKTMISLYFRNKTTKEIEPEARLIDVKDLVKDPYITLLKLLIDGPKNDNLENIMPEDSKINSVKISNDILTIDFSKEFIDNAETGKDAEEQIMQSIVKTLTELTEVNSIKITIDGEENKAFKDNEVSFERNFIRPE